MRQILGALNAKGIKITPCMKCKEDSYQILELSSMLDVLIGQRRSTAINLHSIIIVCENCGYKTEFSKPQLGLYDPP